MLQILIVICLLFKASTSQIVHGSATADYGEDARYSCAVADSTGVVQVMWQRLIKGGTIENLATYSERFGREVNEPYRGKVVFTEASLSSTSIILKNVTWKDESCYICSFNVYPDGSKERQICLTVRGISKVNTSHSVISGHEKEDREVVFRCSATGKPPPTVQWDFSPGAAPLDRPQTTTVTNGDRTFTSSRSITLKVPSDWDGHADCLLNSGMEGRRKERIPLSLRDGNGAQEEGKGMPPLGIALVIAAVLCVSCIIVAVALKRRRLKSRSEIVA